MGFKDLAIIQAMTCNKKYEKRCENLEDRLEFPLIALVVSGGHTSLIYMDEDYSFKKIGDDRFFVSAKFRLTESKDD